MELRMDTMSSSVGTSGNTNMTQGNTVSTDASLLPKSFDELLAGLLPGTSTGEASEVEKKLRLEFDTIANSSEGLTAANLVELRKKAQEIYSAELTPADQLLLKKFEFRIVKLLAKNEGSLPGLPLGDKSNAFLTGSAMSELYKILTDIALLESKIKVEESFLKIAVAKMLIALTDEIAEFTIEAGEVAAKKCILIAQQYITEGFTSIGQALMSAATIALTTIAIKRETANAREQKMNDLFNTNDATRQKYGVRNEAYDSFVATGEGAADVTPPPKYIMPPKGSDKWDALNNDTAPLTLSEESAARNFAITNTNNYMQSITQSMSGAQGFVKGLFEYAKAPLERQSALLDAAKTQMQTLLDMINRSCDVLGKDIEEINSAMQKLLQTLEEVAKVYGQMGGGRG